MSTIRDFLGKDFDRLKRDGERSAFAGQILETADRDELLAVIASIGEHHQGMMKMRDEHDAFQREIRKARYW